jgi:anti-sigma regulatory factor (Ser/Thr protein kinase)
MPHLSRSFTIRPRDFTRAGEVSIEVRSILKSIGFDIALIRRVSLCAYEAEMNVVMHGGNGNLFLNLDPENIIIEVSDDGPGIEDLDQAFQEGFSTATLEHRELGFGAGMGLPNIKRSTDTLEVETGQHEGLYLKMGFKVQANA